MSQQHVSFSMSKEQNGIEVYMTVVYIGRDLIVAVYGGDQAHIGAMALAQPRPSLDDPDKISASTSVICVMGHKEDLLAHQIAQSLASALNCVVSVSCGIHIDNANNQQIHTIQTLVNELLIDFLKQS